MTEIETTRLLLRPWQPDDLAEFTRLLTDQVVTRYRNSISRVLVGVVVADVVMLAPLWSSSPPRRS